MSSAGIAALNPTEEESALALFRGLKSPQISNESILVYVLVSGSSAVPMRVLESESIASVKLKIQDYKGYLVKKQKLICDGKELARSNSLVRDYGVGEGNILHLVVRLSDLRMISVKTVSGKTIEFHTERSRNVAYVKQQIAEKGKDLVNLKDQKVLFDGEELDDDQLLISDIHDSNNDIHDIHLLVCDSAKVVREPHDKGYELYIEAANFHDDTISKTSGISFWLEPVVGNSKIELPSVVKDMVNSTFAGLERGNKPVPSTEGSGGAYFMQDFTGRRYLSVFKPIDEEPMAENNPRGTPLSEDGEGLKSGTRVGEGAFREVAAYILDHPENGPRLSGDSDGIGFAGVPPTVLVHCLHEGFHHPRGYRGTAENYKLGSLQMFMKNSGSCEDMGPRAFEVQNVHKISVLDIRLANADRHGGNILVCRGDEGKLNLVPIDHGYCLPENFEDCTFEWLYWPQARVPYNVETVEYIRALDAEQDIDLLKRYGWELSVECARTLRISTMLLKKGVERGLTPFIIGNMMCRETIKKEAAIEDIIHKAKEAMLPCTSETAFMETVSDAMDDYLDKLTG